MGELAEGLVAFTVEEVKAMAFALGEAGWKKAEEEILKRIKDRVPPSGGEGGS